MLITDPEGSGEMYVERGHPRQRATDYIEAKTNWTALAIWGRRENQGEVNVGRKNIYIQ